MRVSVKDVKGQTHEQPPTEAHPREMRKALHDEEAEGSAHGCYDPDEWHPEWTPALWFGVPKYQHPNADQRERKQRPDIGEIVCLARVTNQ